MTEGTPTPSTSKKKQIYCKFFMRGLCNKEDKCDYLHQEDESWGFQSYSFLTKKVDETCPYYSYGFCRDGSLCPYNHIKLPDIEVIICVIILRYLMNFLYG